MAKLNWERASQRSRMYEGMDFLERVERSDARWDEREIAREARIEANRAARSAKRSVRPLTKAEKRALAAEAKQLSISTQRFGDAKLQQLFSQLSLEASTLKVGEAVLRRRRLLALNAGHSVKEILEAGRLEGPIGAGPLTKSAASRPRPKRKTPGISVGPLPISTTERLRREAEASGRAPRPASGGGPTAAGGRSPIVSRSAGHPPLPPTSKRSRPSPERSGGNTTTAVRKAGAKPKPSKAQRDRAEAAQRHITVEQLIAERRAKAAADAALAAEARALGLTTKELRKQRSAQR